MKYKTIWHKTQVKNDCLMRKDLSSTASIYDNLLPCGILNQPKQVRVGNIIPYMIINWQNVKLPIGYIPCIGQKLSKLDYAELYTYIGDELFGLPYPGDEYFYAPDLRDRYISSINDADRYLGKLLESFNPLHSHEGKCSEKGSYHKHLCDSFYVGGTRNGTGGTGYRSFGHRRPVTTEGSIHTHEGLKTDISEGDGYEFRPFTTYVLYLIKF